MVTRKFSQNQNLFNNIDLRAKKKVAYLSRDSQKFFNMEYRPSQFFYFLKKAKKRRFLAIFFLTGR